MSGLLFLFGLLTGLWLGWVWAHNTVANELDRLGKFYVGKRVYKGEQVNDRDSATL